MNSRQINLTTASLILKRVTFDLISKFKTTHLVHASVAFLTIFLPACALTPEQQVERAKEEITSRPFEEWPELYKNLEEEGIITHACRQQWMEAWNLENDKREKHRIAEYKERRRAAAEQKKIWDSLTPAQKIDFSIRMQELENQQAMMAQQQANMERQADAETRARIASLFTQMGNNFQQGYQNQQIINAYENRTRVMSEPVDINLKGNINHTYNPSYYKY